MELYNSIIRKVEELAGSSTPRRCPYDPQGAWEDTGSFELVMLRDAAYELGGSSKPAVNFTCVTTSAQLVEQDEILVFGPDLTELRGDIEKAVKEAEQYAAEDAKIKEKVEVRNQADQMVYQSEKTLSEVGDKLPESEKAPIQAGIDKLKETLKGEDTDAIKAATEELTQLFYKMSEKLYQQQAPQGDPTQAGQQGGAQGDQGGQYYDADYKVVDDDDKNK